MKIYVLSRGRPDCQTPEILDNANIEFTLVRTYDDKTEYPRLAFQNTIYVVAEGIAEKRQYLLRQHMRKKTRFLMLDDDLRFFLNLGKGKLHRIDDDPDELRAMFELMDTFLDRYPQVGIAERFMCQNRADFFEVNKKCLHMIGINPELFNNVRPQFRVPVGEDIDFTLQLLNSGLYNAIITDYIHDDLKPHAPGGCSLWRTKELEARTNRQLEMWWPGIVKATTRRSDGWPTIRVAWRKFKR